MFFNTYCDPQQLHCTQKQINESHKYLTIVVSTGASLEDVWALVVIASNQQTHAVGTLAVTLQGELSI